MTADTQGIDNRSVDNLLRDVDKAPDSTDAQVQAAIENIRTFHNQEWAIERRWNSTGKHGARWWICLRGVGGQVIASALEPTLPDAIAILRREIAESEAADSATRTPGDAAATTPNSATSGDKPPICGVWPYITTPMSPDHPGIQALRAATDDRATPEWCSCEHRLDQGRISAVLGSVATCSKCGNRIKPAPSDDGSPSMLGEGGGAC